MNQNDLEILDVSGVDDILLERFRCTEDNLALFLKYNAKAYHKAGAGHTTVFIDKVRNRVIGYFTLKCSCVNINDPEMSYEPRIIPAVEIARFAIDQRIEKQGNGKMVFSFALATIDVLKKSFIGVQMIILFSLPNVTWFYGKYGFEVIDKTMATYECKDNEGCICMYSMINGTDE